jgi:hypothetical protein
LAVAAASKSPLAILNLSLTDAALWRLTIDFVVGVFSTSPVLLVTASLSSCRLGFRHH